MREPVRCVCGGEGSMMSSDIGVRDRHSIVCRRCMTGGSVGESEEAAIAAWDKMIFVLKSHGKLVDALEAASEGLGAALCSSSEWWVTAGEAEDKVTKARALVDVDAKKT